MWPHERLLVYERALEAAALLEGVAVELGARRPDLREQLRRASASVALNVAEGASEHPGLERARFFRIARRSAAECAAILDLAQRCGMLNAANTGRDHAPRQLLAEVALMLGALIARNAPRRP